MDMDISMDIHAKSVDMDMDMDGKFHIHGNPGKNRWIDTSLQPAGTRLVQSPLLETRAWRTGGIQNKATATTRNGAHN